MSIQKSIPVEQLILTLRGERVIIDADLARLYEVSTGALNQAVKRNREKFPTDFMFQLTKEEKIEVITICDNLKKIKYSPKLPHAFTEHGALMAANVLYSKRATEMSLFVIRAFVKMREFFGQKTELARKLSQLEGRVSNHDENIKAIIETIRQLIEPPKSKRRQIGFGK